MAGKPATISDLFTPMKSIESCMERTGTEINNNLLNINDSVLNCAGNLSAGNKLIRSATRQINKTITDSFKKLNEITEKQVSSGATSGVAMAATVSNSISAGFGTMSNMMIETNQQLVQIVDYVKKIEKNTKSGGVKTDIKDTVKNKLFSKKPKIDAPDVSGGKGAGDLAKALADAAKTINGISLKDSFLIKMKAKKIIGGILDIFKEYDKELNESYMKKKQAAMSSLADISKSFNTTVKNMASSMILAPFAVIGTKLSSKVISNLITATEQLDAKKLAKQQLAAKSLEEISASILQFNANMALASILAIPAIIGTALTQVIISKALLAIEPLTTAEGTTEAKTAAMNLAAIGTSILKFEASMALSSILAIPAITGAAASWLVIKGSVFLFSLIGSEKTMVDIRSAALGLNLMALSMVTFTLSILATTMITKYLITGGTGEVNPFNIVSLIGSVAIFGLMFGAAKLFGRLGSGKNMKNVLMGSGALALMGISVITFSLAIYTSYMVTKAIIGNAMSDGKFDVTDALSIISIAPIFLLMLGSYKLYSRIGSPKSAKDVLLGGLSIITMSAAFIVFAYSLKISQGLVSDLWKTSDGKTDWGTMLKTVAIFGLMALSGLVFKKIGNSAKDILIGSLTTLAMSVGLLAFGFGLKFAVDPIRENSAGDLWLAPVLLGAFAIEFGIMGAAAGPIALGAAASLALSVGLAAFGFGLEFMTDALLGVSIDDAIKSAKLIGLFGLEFAGLGVASPLILVGSAAIAAAGIAIKSLGEGLSKWPKEKIDITSIGETINGIKLAFQGDPKGEKKGIGGFFSKLGSFVSAPFDLAAVTTTAKALSVAGDSMVSLAKGIKAWQAENIDVTSIEGFVTIVGSLKSAFSEIGDKPAGEKSLLKSLIGADLSSLKMTDVDRGIRSTKRMGSALTSIAKALMNWDDMFGKKLRDEKYMKGVAESVANVVRTLAEPFAKFAQDKDIKENAKTGSTLLGRFFQDLTVNAFGPKYKTRTELGIKSVKDLGKTIKDIAEGFKAFKDINNPKLITDVASGITALLNGLQEPLIAFGTVDESFEIEKIQNSSRKYDEALTGVHDISKQTLNFHHHKTDVAAAMKNVGQIGEMVKGLAEGAKIMAGANMRKDIGKAGIIDEDFNVSDDANGMVGNIQRLVCSQLSVFMNLGKKIQEVGIYDDIQDEVVKDKGWFGRETSKSVSVNKGKKSYLGLAVESATGIGQVILSLADGYERMNKSFPSDKAMTSGVSKVTRAISAIMTAFNTIGLSLTSDGSQESFDLIPASMGMPELTKSFGKIGNLRRLYTWPGSDNPYIKASDLIKTTAKNLADASISLNELKPNNGKAFSKFVNEMSIGMNTLAQTDTNIQHATTFIESLRSANKEKVFESISGNADKISKSINSLDKEVFEPYANMITALGTMTEKHSEFVDLQKELCDLLEKIVVKLDNGTSNTTTNNSVGQPAQSEKQTKPAEKKEDKQVVAKLNTNSVKLDTGNFIPDLEAALKRVKASLGN